MSVTLQLALVCAATNDQDLNKLSGINSSESKAAAPSSNMLLYTSDASQDPSSQPALSSQKQGMLALCLLI